MNDTPVKTAWIEIAPASASAGAPGYGAHLALPPAGSGPGLVLFAEIFGVNAHIRGVAAQYALDGFVVLVPDLFWRQAPRVELGYDGDDRQRAMALIKDYGSKPQDMLADVGAAVAALRARPAVRGKAGAIGYCLGGRLAYLAAATAGVDAAVCYYGGGIHTQLDRAPSVACPIQFHYAESDDNIPLTAVESVRDAFVGKPAEVFIYPGSHHGFNCWARSSYDAPSAALAHGRSLAFLAEKLF